MKKIRLFILLCTAFALTACEEGQTTPELPVGGATIRIDTPTLMLLPGQSETLIASITPDDADDKSVVWSSDDASIATVGTSGVVTGVAAGVTKIWAAAKTDLSKKAFCTITVAAEQIPVTGLTLEKSLMIEVDQTKALSVTVAPEDATDRSITWDSSDKTVATVSKTGSVTGLSIGTTIITVTSNADSSKSATCEVTVTEKSIPATDMWMKTTKLELKVGELKPLDAAPIPTNTTDQAMLWSSDDETIATVSAEGVVTGVEAGTTTIWVKWGPDPSIKDKCTVTVLAALSYTVGDLYPDAASPIGVVFWKDPTNPAKGKIVSLVETRIEWALEKELRNASDENDGRVNMETIRAIPGWADLYPAFKWCSDMGRDWYLPAISEMKAVYEAREAINAAVATIDGAAELDNNKDYWTSTERALSPKYSAATIQFYKGFGGGGAPAGGTSFGSKDGENNTRAIMIF